MTRTTQNVVSGRHRRVRRMRPLSSDPTRAPRAREAALARKLARTLKAAPRG